MKVHINKLIGALLCAVMLLSILPISAFAAQSGNISGGVTLDGKELTVTQNTAASNGVLYNLNRQYAQYLVFLIH